MVKIKKILIFILSVFMFCCIGLMATGCDDEQSEEEEAVGTFYSLQEAYDKGLISQDDLKSIAYNNNNDEPNSDILESSISNAIKKSAAEYLRNREENPIAEANESGFEIVKYLGRYSGSYVIGIKNDYELHPDDVPNIWTEINGTQFNYVGYYIIAVWKAK